MRVEIPVRTWSEPNVRVHWATRARRARLQRTSARNAIRVALAQDGHPTPPIVVTLTRLASRILDTDNLAAALKAVRDGVADALEIDDGDERVTWRYGQEKSAGGKYAVRVEVA